MNILSKNLVDCYLFDEEPILHELIGQYYWNILHLHKDRESGKYFKVSGSTIIDNKWYDAYLMDEAEIPSDIDESLIEHDLKEVVGKVKKIRDEYHKGEFKDAPIMMTTVDGAFEMFTVGIQPTGTWPATLFLDKTYYKIVTSDNGRNRFVECFGSFCWIFQHYIDTCSSCLIRNCLNGSLINNKPFDINKKYEWNEVPKDGVMYQFVDIDDAYQFAYSAEYILENGGYNIHTELLDKWIIFEKGHSVRSYPINCYEDSFKNGYINWIDYDKERGLWFSFNKDDATLKG